MPDVVFAKAEDILVEVQNIIGEVAGTGVQQFSEDTTYSALRRAFHMSFIKRPWEQYVRWGSFGLDGVTGKITATDPFGDVGGPDLQNFVGVFRDKETQPLPVFNNRQNPYVYTGTQVLCWTSLPASDPDFVKKRLQFYPVTAINVVNVAVKLPPVQIIPDTVLYLDRMMLEMGTAWQVLDADGTNPGAADTLKQMFDLRFRDIEHVLSSQPLQIRGAETVPSQWYEAP